MRNRIRHIFTILLMLPLALMAEGDKVMGGVFYELILPGLVTAVLCVLTGVLTIIVGVYNSYKLNMISIISSILVMIGVIYLMVIIGMGDPLGFIIPPMLILSLIFLFLNIRFIRRKKNRS